MDSELRVTCSDPPPVPDRVQTGQVLLMTNRGAVTYSGLTSPPPFDAAFTNAGDMSSLLALNGLAANDGNNWTPSK